jgi:hypothetical protein
MQKELILSESEKQARRESAAKNREKRKKLSKNNQLALVSLIISSINIKEIQQILSGSNLIYTKFNILSLILSHGI